MINTAVSAFVSAKEKKKKKKGNGFYSFNDMQSEDSNTHIPN